MGLSNFIPFTRSLNVARSVRHFALVACVLYFLSCGGLWMIILCWALCHHFWFGCISCRIIFLVWFFFVYARLLEAKQAVTSVAHSSQTVAWGEASFLSRLTELKKTISVKFDK